MQTVFSKTGQLKQNPKPGADFTAMAGYLNGRFDQIRTDKIVLNPRFLVASQLVLKENSKLIQNHFSFTQKSQILSQNDTFEPIFDKPCYYFLIIYQTTNCLDG